MNPRHKGQWNLNITRFLLFVTILCVMTIVRDQRVSGQSANNEPLTADDFTLAAVQGFGDRHNSWAWSMQWWNGHLYVGTNRSWKCAETAALNVAVKLVPYPPADPDVECTPNVADLPLQAEIWRWSPQSDSWERVYKAPADVPIPLEPGKFIARDVGYRGMTVFREPDGTEALYVGGVSGRFLGYDVPPARILRSTDGIHFEALPQEPGTVLGDIGATSFRQLSSFEGKLYVVAASVQGSGELLEGTDPAKGNDGFRIVSGPGVMVSATYSFNGYLYLGLRNRNEGFSIVKTKATGTPPYELEPVITQGGYAISGPANAEILSLQEFNNYLYAGGNGIIDDFTGVGNMAELVRIAPDDTWELVVGHARLSLNGFRAPISGLDAGFGNIFNVHMWRMAVYDNHLYVGTFDSSTVYRLDTDLGPYAKEYLGFDLYRSADGVTFEPVTTDGMNDPFNFGVRALEATPYGLFLGTANYYYGLQIWRGIAGDGVNTTTGGVLYVPYVAAD